MSAQLRQYLMERYGSDGIAFSRKKMGVPYSGIDFVCVDDRDDNDSLTDFCNIFCKAILPCSVRVELTGKFPITNDMADFAKRHGGLSDPVRGRLAMTIPVDKPEAVDQFARLVKTTANLGSLAGNPVWFRVSARTVSSLLRLGRVMREFSKENLRGGG